MKHILLCVLPLLFFSAGCSKTDKLSSDLSRTALVACPEYFYYYNKERIPLTPMPQYITIGFHPKTALLEKDNVIRSYRQVKGFISEGQMETGTVHVAQLQPGMRCEETLRLITDMKKQAAVTYANMVFAAPSSVGADYSWIGITPEFIVTIASPENTEDLNKLVAGNNLRIADKLGETSFMLTADKHAKGSALEMANLFAEKEWVITSEPNFYFQNRQVSGGTEK